MMKCRRFLLTVACLLAGVIAPAADWPEFRGPTGQGIVPEGSLAVEWSDTKNVVWKRPIPGTGWSSPVVASGRIYLTASVPLKDGAVADQSLRALALDAATGNILWDKEVFLQVGAKAARIHSKNSHASSTPVVGGRRLFVHFGHQGTACLDLDGNVLWRNTSLTYNPVHGNGGSPVLVENALVFNCDGGDQQFVAALEADTGKLLWKTDRNADPFKGFSFCTPLVISVNGRKQIISPGSEMIGAYDPGTGKEIWRVRTEGYSVVPRPIFGHGMLFVCAGYDSPQLLAIRPGGQGDVTETHVAWTSRKSVPLTPSPVLVGDELYMMSDGGFASCLDAKSGRVQWTQRLGGNYSASPLTADGKIYFLSEQGSAIVIKASKRFEEVARNELHERTLASPAAADGALYIRTEKHLYRIQERGRQGRR